MKTCFKKVSAMLLAVLMSVSLFQLPVYAEQLPVTAELPVSVQETGDVPSPAENYTIRLTAVDGAPMPVSGEDQVDITITGAGTACFPAITYPTVGIYHYTIRQIPGEHPRAIYDESVYDVTVTVTNTEDGEGLETTIAIRKDDKKFEAAEFVNEYYQEITVKKVWSDNGKERPESITVKLMSGDEELDTVELSEENEWTYTWLDVIREGEEWEVIEDPVPGKYKVSYSYDGSVATITNTLTEEMIETGQLKWPVPVFGGAGVLLVIYGAVVLMKSRKKNNA